jgi:hypothetical protein
VKRQKNSVGHIRFLGFRVERTDKWHRIPKLIEALVAYATIDQPTTNKTNKKTSNSVINGATVIIEFLIDFFFHLHVKIQ